MQVIPHPVKSVRERLAARYVARHRSATPVRLTVPHARGDIDLGTYPGQRAAESAYATVSPHLSSPDPWPAIWELQRAGVVAPDAYPSHVRAVVDSAGRVAYSGKAKVGGDELETSRLFRAPNTAEATLAKSVRSYEVRLAAELAFVRTRQRRDELPKYLRFTKGNAIQARPWVSVLPYWSAGVNLGLWSRNLFGGDRHAQIAFGKFAAMTFVKLFSGPPIRDAWDVIQQMQQMRHMGLQVVRSHVLPPRVKRLPDGRFCGRVKRWGEVVWESLPCETVAEAWAAVKAYKAMRVKAAGRPGGGSRFAAAGAVSLCRGC